MLYDFIYVAFWNDRILKMENSPGIRNVGG